MVKLNGGCGGKGMLRGGCVCVCHCGWPLLKDYSKRGNSKWVCVLVLESVHSKHGNSINGENVNGVKLVERVM